MSGTHHEQKLPSLFKGAGMGEGKENLLTLREIKISPPAPSKNRGQGEAREKERNSLQILSLQSVFHTLS